MKRRLPLAALRATSTPKLSQSKVARLSGMGLNRFWQIENGEGPTPTTDEREAIAVALGVKVSDIAWPEFTRAEAS